MTALVLTAGSNRLLATAEGGGLLEFSHAGRHILRPATKPPTGPLDRAMIVMAPWCNRIGGGGFDFGDSFHALAANLPPFPLPLHGNAFQSPWQVRHQATDRLTMAMSSNGPAGFCYGADVHYRLEPSGLTVILKVINLGARPMPFAIGLHPWFATSPGTRLELVATGQLATDGAGLPVHEAELEPSFVRPGHLPDGRVDHTLLGWDGRAVLFNADLTIELVSYAPYLHLFSPARAAGFCCLEPQTAPANAVNFLAHPATVLAPNAALAIEMSIKVRERTETG